MKYDLELRTQKGGKMKESNILKQIELYASKCGYLTLRLNSGMFYQGSLEKHNSGADFNEFTLCARLP